MHSMPSRAIDSLAATAGRPAARTDALGLVLISILSLSVVLGAAGGAGTAVAQEPEPSFQSLTVPVGGNQITGQIEIEDGAEIPFVEARLIGGPEHAALEGYGLAGDRVEALGGHIELSFKSQGVAPPLPRRIEAGDRIEFTLHTEDGAQAIPSVLVPMLTAGVSAEGELFGQAPAGSRLYLAAFDPEGQFERQSLELPDDPSGLAEWRTRLENLATAPGTYGTVLILEEGVAFQTSFAIPDPRMAIGSDLLELRARPGEILRASLRNAEGELRGSAIDHNQSGQMQLRFRDAAGEPVLLQPGDRISIQFDAGLVQPEQAKIELAIPSISVDVDTESERLRGLAEPGLRILVSVDELSREAIADESGSWQLDLSGELDLVNDSRVVLSLPEHPGITWTAYRPWVYALDPLEAAVKGRGPAGAWVRMERWRDAAQSEAVAEGHVDANGHFELAIFEDDPAQPRSASPMALTLGDTIGWYMKMAPVDLDETELWAQAAIPAPPINVHVDATRGRVEGSSGLYDDVTLEIPHLELVQETQASGEGDWAFDIGYPSLRGAGQDIRLTSSHPETEGLTRQLSFQNLRASAQVHGERVLIEGPPGAEVKAELEREGARIASGSCRIARDACEALLRDGSGLPIEGQAGDIVAILPAADSGLMARSLDLVPLTAHIDLTGFDVTGEAPPDDAVTIIFLNDQGDGLPLGTGIGSDDTGVYDYELSGSQYDLLVPGLMADVFYRLAGGHRQMARGLIEAVYAEPGNADLRGYAEPATHVKAELFASDDENARPIAWAEGRVDGSSEFQLTLRDAAGEEREVRAGMRLSLEHDRGTIERGLPPLVAYPLDPSGRIAGSTEPYARVRAYHHLRHAAGQRDWEMVEAWAGADGRFYLPEPLVEPERIQRVELAVRLGLDGLEWRTDLDLAVEIRQIYLPTMAR